MSAGRAPAEIVLVTHGELGSGAFEAHVLGLLRLLSPSATLHLVALASPRDFATASGRARVAGVKRRAAAWASGGVAIVPHAPRRLALAADGWTLARAVSQLRRGPGPLVFHARGYLAALAAHAARRGAFPSASLLHDVRGDRVAEVRAFGGEFAPDVVAHLEREACRVSEAHACVSTPLAQYLLAHCGVQRAEVFACAADTQAFRPDAAARQAVRAQLGVQDHELLLGFSGGLAGWQRPDALAALFARVRVHAPAARLLVLTPDVGAYSAALAVGIGQGALRAVHVTNVPHAEVPGQLAACDLTALLRDVDAVNAVASPIKFGESLACGVPVLLTQGLGDASRLVAEQDLGAVVSDPLLGGADDDRRLTALLAALEADREGFARRCREAAVRQWSWQEQLPRWLALHARLADGARD